MKQVSLQTCSSSGVSVNALCLLYVQHDAHTKDREAGELLQRGAEKLRMGLSEVQSPTGTLITQGRESAAASCVCYGKARCWMLGIKPKALCSWASALPLIYICSPFCLRSGPTTTGELFYTFLYVHSRCTPDRGVLVTSAINCPTA